MSIPAAERLRDGRIRIPRTAIEADGTIAHAIDIVEPGDPVFEAWDAYLKATQRPGPARQIKALTWHRTGLVFTVTPPYQGETKAKKKPVEPTGGQPAWDEAPPPQRQAKALAWSRGGLRLQVKAADDDFERLHPRGANGRFIRIGGRVRLSPIVGGGGGIVEAINPNGRSATIRLDNGDRREFDKRHITVLGDNEAAGGAPPQPHDKDASRLAEAGVPTVTVPTVAVPPIAPTADDTLGGAARPGAGLGATEVDGATFHTAIAEARSGPKGAFLSLYTPAEYDQMRAFLAHDGKVGGALKDHGDGRVEIVSLFNNGGPRGAGLKLADHLMAQGGNYAEAYGDDLRALYESKGFQVSESHPFDRELAAADWDYARNGTPNYYQLRKAPDEQPNNTAGAGAPGDRERPAVPGQAPGVVRREPEQGQPGDAAERVGVPVLPAGDSAPVATLGAAPAKPAKAAKRTKRVAPPVDAHGKVIEVGSAVNVLGGGEGTVVANRGDGTIDVNIGGGEHRSVPQDWLAVTARPGGGTPTADPAEATPAPVVTDGPVLPSHVPNIPAGAGWPVWPPPDPNAPELTPAQASAAKGKYKLPTGTGPELRQQLAELTADPVPTVEELIATGMSPEAAAKDHKRLLSNSAWRTARDRRALRAAIDTIDARDRHLPDPAAANTPPTAAEMRLMMDEELAAAVGRFGDNDDVLDALLAELERRDVPGGGDDPGANTPEQDRIDQLVAQGATLDEAIAEVYQTTAEKITRSNQAGAVASERLPGESLDQATRRIYDEWVDMETVAAENATRGNLLSPEGKRAGVNAATLFSGPAATARKYASEELKRYWAESGRRRRTFTEFKADMLGREADRAAASAIRSQGSGRDFGL